MSLTHSELIFPYTTRKSRACAVHHIGCQALKPLPVGGEYGGPSKVGDCWILFLLTVPCAIFFTVSWIISSLGLLQIEVLWMCLSLWHALRSEIVKLNENKTEQKLFSKVFMWLQLLVCVCACLCMCRCLWMCRCTHMCEYVSVCRCTHACMFVSVQVHMCVQLHVCVHVHVCEYRYTHVCECAGAHICACLWVCRYTCMCMFVSVQVHTVF